MELYILYVDATFRVKGLLHKQPASDQLKAHEWVSIESIVSVLATVHVLTLGDFYKYWLELIFQLKNINNDIDKKILANIKSRQIMLLENDTIYAALFLDPRFRRLLTRHKKDAAKRHLKKIVQQIQNLKKVSYLLSVRQTLCVLLNINNCFY